MYIRTTVCDIIMYIINMRLYTMSNKIKIKLYFQFDHRRWADAKQLMNFECGHYG